MGGSLRLHCKALASCMSISPGSSFTPMLSPLHCMSRIPMSSVYLLYLLSFPSQLLSLVPWILWQYVHASCLCRKGRAFCTRPQLVRQPPRPWDDGSLCYVWVPSVQPWLPSHLPMVCYRNTKLLLHDLAQSFPKTNLTHYTHNKRITTIHKTFKSRSRAIVMLLLCKLACLIGFLGGYESKNKNKNPFHFVTG